MNKSLTTLLLGIGLFSVWLTSCKSVSVSDGKDIGLSPRDLSKDTPTIWQADKLVHYGICPVGSASINHNCLGMVEKFVPLDLDKFSQAVTSAIIARRPAGSGPASSPQTLQLQDKLNRLKAKVAAGGMTAAAQANLAAQISTLEAALFSPQVALTATELNDYNAVMAPLQAGKDFVFDEEETGYELATAPFTGPGAKAVALNCLTGSKILNGACWYKGKAGESCKDICGGLTPPLKMSAQTVTFAGSSGTDANCYAVAALYGSTSQGGANTGGKNEGVGCVENSGDIYRYTRPATDESGLEPDSARFCACE